MSLQDPTFSANPYFFGRDQDRASYSGSSADQLEGESWRGGNNAGSAVGVRGI